MKKENEVLEELKKEVKKLYSLEEKLTDDFEIDYPTKLSLEVQKQYEKIFIGLSLLFRK